mgnify:CR=1 FL=1
MILSVIIPAFNAEGYLARCLESLLKQEWGGSKFEIIIINDGSIDRTLEIAREFEKDNDSVICINQKNQGPGATRNSGIRKAKGEYIYFIDSDDYLIDNCITILLDCLRKNKLDILTFKSVKVNEIDYKSHIDANGLSTLLNPVDGIAYIDKYGFKFEVWWYIIRREFLVESGLKLVEGRFMEDAYFTAKLFLTANSIAHIPLDAHRYQQEPNSILNRTDTKHIRNTISDLSLLAEQYEDLISNTRKSHPNSKGCINRLKISQEFFVFYLITRAYKIKMDFKSLNKILKRMKALNAYPLVLFTQVYNDKMTRRLTFIFNNKALLLLMFTGGRLYSTIKTLGSSQ